MSRATPLECVALTMVRWMSHLSVQKVAGELRIPKKKLVDHETFLVPPPDLLDAVLEVLDQPRTLYEGVLSALYHVQRGMAPPPPATPVDPTPEEWSEMQARALAVGREAELRAMESQVEASRTRKTAEARAEAETLCARLESEPKPWLVVEKAREVQTWAVAERLAHRSAEVAPDCVDRAMELAALAYRVAELAPCEGPFRESLLGYTMAFGENVLRADGDFAGAEELFVRAEEHWQAGAAAQGPLEEWRLQGLAGSFYRDQQRFAESLAQLDASLAKAPARDRGRLLVTKALTVERMGKPEQAIKLLIEAAQLAERQCDSRLRFMALYNRAAFHSRLGQFAEAEILLRELTELAKPLGRGLSQARLRWLRGAVAAGFERWDEAETELQTARRELASRNRLLESALVALELLVLLCRRERSPEIRRLVSWLAPLARSGKLSRDARAALQLVCNAAGSGVTLDLAEQALRLLQRAPKADAAGAGRSIGLAGGGSDGAMAAAAGVEPAAAIQRPGGTRELQEIAGRGPDGGHPGEELVHQAGRLPGTGPAGRQGGSGRREEDEEAEAGSERTPGDYASKHEMAPSGNDSRRGLSWPRRSPRPENTGAENRIAPSPEICSEDFIVLVRLLMALRNLTQEGFAAAARISPTTLCNYQTGNTVPFPARIRPVVEQLARAAKVPLFIVDFYLLPGIAALRKAGGWTLDDMVETIHRRLREEMQGLVHLLLLPSGPGSKDPGTSWPPAEVARQEALDLWNRLEGCDEAERWSLVEWREYRHPGLAELLCHLSEEAASDRADRALELAKLAHRVAELAPGEPAEKQRLLGYSGIYLGNAVRVVGELLPARERFDEALASWKAGEGSATFLAEWRVLDREASLLREERQFGVALDRQKKALAIAPVEASGRILLNRAFTFEQMGDGERALEELRKAEPLINRERDPRLFLVLRFNTATALCLLDQFEEAEGMYPEIQDLAASLQRELDGVRLKWLAGRIAAGRGRLDEADAILDEVRQEFTDRSAPWDCSLVTLELATVRLRQGRTADVRSLAGELVWIFKAQGIHQEALAALTLFREAAERDLATADFTDRLVRYFRKAQGDPGLRFLE